MNEKDTMEMVDYVEMRKTLIRRKAMEVAVDQQKFATAIIEPLAGDPGADAEASAESREWCLFEGKNGFKGRYMRRDFNKPRNGATIAWEMAIEDLCAAPIPGGPRKTEAFVVQVLETRGDPREAQLEEFYLEWFADEKYETKETMLLN